MAEEDDPYNMYPDSVGTPGPVPGPAPSGKVWSLDETGQAWVLKNIEDAGSPINFPDGTSGREVARVALATDCGNYPGTVAMPLQGGTGYSCVVRSSLTTKAPAPTPAPTTRPKPAPRAIQAPQQSVWWTYPKTGDTKIVKSVIGKGGYSDYLSSLTEKK